MPKKETRVETRLQYFQKEFKQLLPYWGIINIVIFIISNSISCFVNDGFKPILQVIIPSIVLILSQVRLFIIGCRKRSEDISELNEIEKKLRDLSGDKTTLDVLNEKFPELKKIAIVGIGSVGKTSLIENICRVDNESIRTKEKQAYIHNFSSKKNQYAAMLDASGQNIPALNDIALDADILIVLLDHNSSHEKEEIDDLRINEHRAFLNILRQRLNTSRHYPSYIFFYLNKKDLWSKLTKEDQNSLKTKLTTEISKFESMYINVQFSLENFSTYMDSSIKSICKNLEDKLKKKPND